MADARLTSVEKRTDTRMGLVFCMLKDMMRAVWIADQSPVD